MKKIFSELKEHSNLQGKSKKVWVLGGGKQMTGNTERKNRASTEHLFVQRHFNQINYRIEAGPEKIDHFTLLVG